VGIDVFETPEFYDWFARPVQTILEGMSQMRPLTISDTLYESVHGRTNEELRVCSD